MNDPTIRPPVTRIPLETLRASPRSETAAVLAGFAEVARAVFKPLAIATAILVLVALLLAYQGLRREVDELRAAVRPQGFSSVSDALGAHAARLQAQGSSTEGGRP